MARQHRYVFVLWADGFEEAPATLFVTMLREAGLRVKVIGLTPGRTAGAHGLALLPDLTLDQALALAAQSICMIVPQAAVGLQSLSHEPRLRQLFDLAAENQAQFVIGSPASVTLHELGLLPEVAADQVLTYPEGEAVMVFVEELAGVLLE